MLYNYREKVRNRDACKRSTFSPVSKDWCISRISARNAHKYGIKKNKYPRQNELSRISRTIWNYIYNELYSYTYYGLIYTLYS